FFSSRRRHTRSLRDWSSDVCSSDLPRPPLATRELTMDFVLVEEARHLVLQGERALAVGEVHGQLPGSEWRARSSRVGTAAPKCEIGRASCRERGEVGGEGGG